MNLKSMGKFKTRRNKYQHHTKITLMCRICLTQSNNCMFKLEQEFELPEGEFVSYLKALEDVTTSKVVLNGDYPENICPVCASILKMAFKFIRQFKDNQMELRKQFNHTDVQDMKYENGNISVKKEEVDNTPNVELIFQNSKFSINDLLVVENQETEDCDFKGFLENLGKEVTATFVEDIDQKKPQDSENEDMISVSVIDKDRIIPVRQLQIDEDANLIEYVLDENPINIVPLEEQLDEVSRMSKQSDNENEKSIDGKNMSDDGEDENIEYIKIDILDQDAIDSLIIDRTEFVNSQAESTSNNDTPRKKRRVGKRRKKQTPEVEDEFQKEVTFPCEICQNIFASRTRLRAHKNRVHFRKEKTFTCEICGYLCRTRSAFVHHKFTHEEKQFKCQICDKAYHTKAVLKVHMGTHANKRQNLCNVCGKGFNYPIALTYHMRLHTGEKNYHCDFCDRSFRMPNSLTRHRRTHTGDRPFSCRYCDRVFCSKGEVKCHEYIHTGFRPYHCKYCRKGFSKTHNLKLHLLSHKGSHQCDICDRSFIEPAILKMHYKISHKNFSQNDEEESTDSQKGNSNVVISDYIEYK